MASQAVIQKRIDEIEDILRSGVETVNTDGTSTKVNHAELRKERNELRRRLTAHKAVRPVASRINLGGF